MQLCYSCVPKLLSRLPRPFLISAALFLLPIQIRIEKAASATPIASPVQNANLVASQDPRLVRLQRFFVRLHCPIVSLAPEFIRAADANHLDWRLLPGISVIESGGGKAYRNNNIFGWNNGVQPFASLRSAIEQVASRLGNSPLYRNRDSVAKLRLYNPDQNYASAVVNVMNRISPVIDLKPAPARIVQRF